jgi:hypothetical protein
MICPLLRTLSATVALCACCGVSGAADTNAILDRARRLAAPPQSQPSPDQHRLYGDLLPLAIEPSRAKVGNSIEGQLLQLGATRLAAEPRLAPTNAQRRSRAFDASEGTALDPLNNTTFDLNYPHDIPSMK